MEGFDTLSMPYIPGQLPITDMQNPDFLNAMSPLDMREHHPVYDNETFISDDMSFAQHPMSAGPMRRFSNAPFEEPFPDMGIPFENAPPPEQPPADSSIDQNHKLLSFSMPAYNFTLLDYSLRRTHLTMAAQLHGMFFLAQPQYTTSPTSEVNVPPPMAELTCYRRNLFQITGSVTLPRTLRYIMTDQGDRIPVLAQELTVSATESVEGNSVKIISVPWKTPAANATGQPEDKTEKEPPSIPLDTMSGQDVDSDYATFSIAWKRLQFRIATANNGRRKELQQHFVLRLKLMATLSTGAKIPICEAHSAPIIVRGRSPRNFQSRKDLPLSGSAAASRKNAQANNNSLNRTTTNESATSKQAKSPQEPNSATVAAQSEHDFRQQQPQQRQPSVSHPDWTLDQPPHSTAVPNSTFTFENMGSSYAQSSPDASKHREKRRRTSGSGTAVSLSLLDDEPGQQGSGPLQAKAANQGGSASRPAKAGSVHNRTGDTESARPAKSQKKSPTSSSRQPLGHQRNTSGNGSLFAHNVNLSPALTSPLIVNGSDAADLLYEYFPLELEDWQAPVDAVYRPHVVHHTNMPEDPKALAPRSRSKRYFAGET